ncbi:hypothetical protein JCM13664_11300 [Methylothermus subterraneus]
MRLWLGWLLSFTTLIAAAQETLPQAVTIAQLLAIARDRSPRYALLLQRLESARAEVVAARVLPNPRVSYGRYDLTSRRNTMFDGSTQEEVTVEVPLLLFGQRQARIEEAQKKLSATSAEIEAEFAALAYKLWRAFAKLLADQRRVALLEEAATEVERLVRLVAGRAQAGEASRYDLLRIRLEAESLGARLNALRGEVTATARSIGVMLGFPDWRPTALGELRPLEVPADAAALWAAAEQNNPELIAARSEEAAADATVARARRERWPVPSLLAGTAFTDRPYGNTVFSGVSVDLPIFDRGQGNLARAAAQMRQAQLARELIAVQARTALERAVDLIRQRRATRIRFEQEVMARLEDLKAMGEAAYRLGKGSLLELLDAFRSRTETRLSYVGLVQDEIEAELEALKASGLLLKTAR